MPALPNLDDALHKAHKKWEEDRHESARPTNYQSYWFRRGAEALMPYVRELERLLAKHGIEL
ncbi:MAG: hypothetical protein KGJ45_11430 [Elusimicrobia bacterium]|nr:hypothetical protein [Elusimicrobiota bacterium]